MSITTESDEEPLEATPAEPLPQAESPAEMTSGLDAETDAAPTETAVTTPVADTAVEQTPPPTPKPDTLLAETEVETADAPNLAETDPPKRKKAPSTRKRLGQSSQASHKNQPTLRQVTDRFAACGRCSYFLAGYRVIHGVEALETVVAQSQSGWLSLEWDAQMLELTHKSYGVRLDIMHSHYESCCIECRRPFVYQAADSEEEADSFQIGITPRVSQ
jgi:hypothetical protein